MPSDSDQRVSGTKFRNHRHHEALSNYVADRSATVQDSAASPQEGTIHGGIGGLSLDDIEAAQVLESIRAETHQSPRGHQGAYPPDLKIDNPSHGLGAAQNHQDVEPLLSLITSHHTLLSSAINVPLSAYTSTKSYSPSFKYGAELVERHIGSPVVAKLSTAGRLSGMETGVRWLYNGSASQRGSKRRREMKDESGSSDVKDIEKGLYSDLPAHPGMPTHTGNLAHVPSRRISSVSMSESLPPYDDSRSPSYEVYDSSTQHHSTSATQRHPNWQTRMITSTSGLGIAMSEESLRSLKYCLKWLRGANSWVNRMTVALKDAIRELESFYQRSSEPSTRAQGNRSDPSPEPRDQRAITQHIDAIGKGLADAFMGAITVVSKYAGGALPENARTLVASHLRSLPDRLNRASSLEEAEQRPQSEHSEEVPSTSPDSEGSESQRRIRAAQRVVILATEGLDMMSQVSRIIDGTIMSAEEWLDRLGRRKRERRDSVEEHQQLGSDEKRVLVAASGDVKKEHLAGKENEME
ncbi:MAG: hypothetical protein Q9203_003585 [Teloschistes exilis]